MEDITLALSGDGIKAMAFHLGVFRRLAHEGRLENVTNVSSTGGGTLLVGLLLHEAGMAWPRSADYQPLHDALRAKLTGTSLIKGMIRQALRPRHFSLLPYSANMLARTLRYDWGIGETLHSLPAAPLCSFLSVSAEYGVPFVFSKDSLGGQHSGVADSGPMPLSCVLAVSMARPGALGAFMLKTGPYHWKKDRQSPSPLNPKYARLHLYDGGLYDSLALIADPGGHEVGVPHEPAVSGAPNASGASGASGASEDSPRLLLLSDANPPFRQGFSYGAINPLCRKRAMDIMSGRLHSLSLNLLALRDQKSPCARRFCHIGINARLADRSFDNLRDYAVKFPASLRAPDETAFDTIAAYGYETAKETLARDAGTPQQCV